MGVPGAVIRFPWLQKHGNLRGSQKCLIQKLLCEKTFVLMVRESMESTSPSAIAIGLNTLIIPPHTGLHRECHQRTTHQKVVQIGAVERVDAGTRLPVA